jgi:cytidyltransferase-like protein
MRVAVSGYFDPFHAGHLRYFQSARSLGDRLIVIVNNDRQAVLKKGFSYLPENERLEIIRAISYVDDAILSIDVDESVSATLETIKPDVFANGGDRKNDEVPEADICKRLKIRMVDGICGTLNSSTNILNRVKPDVTQIRKKQRVTRTFVEKRWGWEDWIANNDKYCGKILFVKADCQTSFHYHTLKDETMYLSSGISLISYSDSDDESTAKEILLTSGESMHIPVGLRHRIKAIEDSIIYEVSTTHFDSDSKRINL